jgi:hypothetical protein
MLICLGVVCASLTPSVAAYARFATGETFAGTIRPDFARWHCARPAAAVCVVRSRPPASSSAASPPCSLKHRQKVRHTPWLASWAAGGARWKRDSRGRLQDRRQTTERTERSASGMPEDEMPSMHAAHPPLSLPACVARAGSEGLGMNVNLGVNRENEHRMGVSARTHERRGHCTDAHGYDAHHIVSLRPVWPLLLVVRRRLWR